MNNELLRQSRLGNNYLNDLANVRDLPSIDNLLDIYNVLKEKRLKATTYNIFFIDAEIDAIREILRRTSFRELIGKS